MRTVFITGTAGFIGYHLAKLLLSEGFRVVGYDGLTDYYDPQLKKDRHADLLRHNAFSCTIGQLEDFDLLSKACTECEPDIIVHLAGQAGVRYSLENPRSYIDSNIVGSFNVMECARALSVDHLLMASTSSAYGANTEMPYRETDQTVTPLTIYAATKLSVEMMGHSYASLWNLPTTLFRFFTVYGPWARPDMAHHKFAKGILAGEPIDIYNHGDMYRDFTYVTDLVMGIRLLIDTPPPRVEMRETIEPVEGDTLSPVAPYRMVNIGNSSKVRLLDFIEAIEDALGKKAVRNFVDMQPGDVHATWADASLLQRLTHFQPQTDVRDGIAEFVDWYVDYYGIKT